MDFGSRGRSVDRYRRDSRSPRRSRGRRAGSQPPPEPANPLRAWRTPAAPPPSRSEGGRDARVRGGGDSLSRSYLKDRRGPPGLDTKSRPEERPASLSLGLTTGITAAGAWAARFEVAAMLEARCDPNELVTAIRSGKEGPHVLNMAQHDPGSARRSTSQGSWKPAGSTGNTHDDIPRDLFSDGEDWQKEVSKQHAILESLLEFKGDSLPPWAGGSASDKASPVGKGQGGVDAPSASSVGMSAETTPFVKKATPPPGRSPLRRTRPQERGTRDEEVKCVKPATPPPPGPPPEKPERDRRKRRDANTLQSMAAMEAREMHKYHKECNAIYNKLKDLGD